MLKAPTIAQCIKMFTFDEHKKHVYRSRIIRRYDILSEIFSGWSEKEPGETELGSIFSKPLKLDKRMIHFLFNRNSEEYRFESFMKLQLPSKTIPPLLIRGEQVKQLAHLYQDQPGDLLYIAGAEGSGKKFLVSHYCRQEGKKLFLVNVPKLIEEQVMDRWVVKQILREARLHEEAVLCFEQLSPQEPTHWKLLLAVCRLNQSAAPPIFLSTEKWQVRLHNRDLNCRELELAPLKEEEQKLLWEGLLCDISFEKEVNLDQLASRYQLTPGIMALAVMDVVQKTQTKQQTVTEKEIYHAVQRQFEHTLGNNAVRVPVKYTLEDLVLPESQKNLLNSACDVVKYQHQVYSQWDFESKVAYGRGVNILFYGTSGTGKTMGAQAVAGELNMEIYRVDMSSVLSKYVGESEKKLESIFEQGKKSQSILFFDEAESLFGKRSEVKDAQDKYANASTAYLLQKIEDYTGVVILATNLFQNFDEAFSRRFQFVVHFTLPDQARRLKIWENIFPERLPLEAPIDCEYLARQFKLSGSQIKSIALAAAFLAAGAQKKMSLRFILIAAKRELSKVGKSLSREDYGEYYRLMED